LHDITVELYKNKVNCIIGPSGSGKSSLAFDTIFAISQHEMNLIMGNDESTKYEIGYFSNIPSAVAMKQLNFNTNKRSTIATYYGIDKILKFLFSSSCNIAHSLLSFNKYGSACKECEGLGYISEPDVSRLIDYNSIIKNIPFIPWRNSSMKAYYKEVVRLFCEEQQIPMDITFFQLTTDQKKLLLNGAASTKYKISFMQTGRKRTRTDTYHGIIPFVKNEIKDGNSAMLQYCREEVCPVCHGSRFNKKINSYEIQGKSLGDVYLMDFLELINWLQGLSTKNKNILGSSYNTIIDFVNNLIILNLGYLNFNRSIPSLSGGEFQRLRLAQLLQTRFEGLLIILDEPLASVHVYERENIMQMISQIAEKNTLLIVEHNDDILKICDNIIALGPQGGKNGGYIIDKDKYLLSERKHTPVSCISTNKYITLKSTKVIRNVKPFVIKIPLDTCIGIGGFSGSGKTTLIRDILPNCIENYQYISQKPIKGNIYSTVASFIGIVDKIRLLFALANKIDASYFSNFANAKGACRTCNGTGQIVVEEYAVRYTYVCPDCNGTRFSKDILKYQYEDKSIIDLYNGEINDIKNFFKDKDSGIYEQLRLAVDIGLGYLQLNQTIASLSGGEAQRMKLLKYLDVKSQNAFIGLDEPFQGLNNSEINTIMKVLYQLTELHNTIFIVEHNIFALKSCSYIIEFGKGSGKFGGDIIYSGNIDYIKNTSDSQLKEYL
jgi:excinuclease ABC A subunit